MSDDDKTLQQLASSDYKYGFVTDIEQETAPPGLTEEIVRFISEKKQEPSWLLEWRLQALRYWFTQTEPKWARVNYPPIDFQAISYYAAPKQKGDGPKSLDEIDPELRRTYEKLGIPLAEQAILAGVAVDAVFDSVSVATSYKGKLAEKGIIFCSFSEAVREHPELVRKYLGTVVPYRDNYYATLNSAVFSDGSFVYIPPGVRCPMELSTYFRINASNTGQFERTLIIADEGAYVSYLEGCLPPGEQVLTPHGWVNIESLKPGDSVYDHLGQPQPVRAAMTRQYNGELLCIHPISQYNAFRLTPEHPVFAIKHAQANSETLSNIAPQWFPAGELEQGDFVVVPRLQMPAETSPVFTDEQVKLLGHYLAHGTASCHQANHQQHQRMSGADTAAIASAEHEEWLIRHCGASENGKILSPELMNLPLPQLEIFLAAYLAGNCQSDMPENTQLISYTTISEALARQMQMLLNRTGKHAWIQVCADSNSQQTLYQISYSDEQKLERVYNADNYFLVPICKISREAFNGAVFNIDVANTHTYTARGVAVHNCTAPQRDENQLHAAVVELIALDRATIKYSTVQNWYPGDAEGNGGIYNFVTKRGLCRGQDSKISWTQVETGSAITWKYPSCILRGDNSIGEFYSVAITRDYQQADTGTKMIHIGKNTRSTIISKGISTGRGQNAYRGLVKILPTAENARNHSQCDSLLMGNQCGAHTFPYLDVQNPSAQVEHEASTSKINEDQLFYCKQRGISPEDAVSLIVNGFCKDVFKELPMEFAVEAQKLIELKLEGSVG